ncbi:MAG: BREX-2 system adenine-specific DNA-methyltransferase PglX, partial [Myxococcota bacterium]|nr:BREX-2 system adenine-specific DNA-methyltransferase PglX [Myxococcota bacterium]
MASTRSKKSKSKQELAGHDDPRAPLDSTALLAAAKPVLAKLEDDLRARALASPAVTAALTARYEAEKQAQRTADSFAGWTEALATQVAAAWLLSCVFVRTLEDRGLLKQARLAGPGAEDSQRQFFQLAPSLTERDYLLTVFRELAHHPAAAALFDAEHSLVWKLSPSAEVAKELLALFRAPTAAAPAFRFGQLSTRFLGDLYQDLSEDVRKRYALLQTPDFVEEYILDRTLEPAITRFGLDDTTLIDPTCGSGHFLLGAFDRLFEHRLRAQPGLDPRVAAVQALDCVFGADINPYAVAIARFRLTLSFLEKAGYAKLADAPALPLHLVVADSLRINPQHPQQELWQHAGASASEWLGDVFAFDDEKAAKDVLGRTYAAVVANPPYITPKDRALRSAYASMYATCFMNYALSAPFCERVFQLARARGYTGQIT